MRTPHLALVPALAAAVFLFSSVPLKADVYWESEQVVENVPGQENSTRIIKNYVGKDGSRTDMGDTVTIVRYDELVMYQLNPADKTYTRVDMKSLGMPPEGGEMDAEKTAQAQALVKEMFGKMKLVPSDETRTIAGYKCRRYDMNFMMVSTEYWTSDEVKGFEEITASGKKMQEAFASNPILKNTDMLGLMESMKGFPVQIVNRMMGGTSTTTLKKIEKKPLPKSLFVIPEGYKLVEGRKAAGPGMPAMPPPPPARRAPDKK